MKFGIRVACAVALTIALTCPATALASQRVEDCNGYVVSVWTLTIEPWQLAEGDYTFWTKWVGPATEDPSGGPFYFGPRRLTISSSAPLEPYTIKIWNGGTYNPAQRMYIYGSFGLDVSGVWGGTVYTMPQVHEMLDASAIYFSLEPGQSKKMPTAWTLGHDGPAASACADHIFRRTYPSD